MTCTGTSPANFRQASAISFRSASPRDRGLIAANNWMRHCLLMSSTLVPYQISKKMPANTLSPTTRTIHPLGVSKCLYHFSNGVVALRPLRSGKNSGFSSQKMSIRNSKRTATKRTIVPKSRHQLLYLRQASKLWFMPDSTWSDADYDRSRQALHHIRNALLLLVAVAWVIRFLCTGRSF